MLKAFIILLFILSSSTSKAEGLSYQDAINEKKAGNYVKAEIILHHLIANNNNNAELFFQLGLIQRFQKKNHEAFLTQNRALDLSPENSDILLEVARLHSWKKNYELAEEMVNAILEKHPHYTDAQELAEAIKRLKNPPVDVEKSHWQLDLGHENSSFSPKGRPHWKQDFFQLNSWVNDNTLIHIRTERHKRGNITNKHIEVGSSHIYGDTHNSGYFSIGYTPESMILPEWRIKAGGEIRLLYEDEKIGKFWLTGQIQHSKYKTLETTVIKPGIRYIIADNWQIQIQHIDVFDEHNSHLQGWSHRVDWQADAPNLNIFAGLSDSPETDTGTTVYTKAKFIGFSYKLTPKATLHASYAEENRENSFIRKIIATGLSIKF